MSRPLNSAFPSLPGMTVFQRGWLSSNNVLLLGHSDSDGDSDSDEAVLVDSSHVLHAPQTLALLRHALQGRRLEAVVNTHLHSDHCGGNASVQREFDCTLRIPPGQWDAVQAWDDMALSYAPTGQRCERFSADAVLAPGEPLLVGGQRWQALAAPGHDPHSLILFNAELRTVISADALWERGFGIVFPELDGGAGFDEVEATLDLIASLDAQWAIPGHGAPFGDVPAALQRARERLAAFRANPAKHARHAMKALVAYHLLETQALGEVETLAALLHWFGSVGMYRQVWEQLGRPAGTLQRYGTELVDDLARAGVLVQRDGMVASAPLSL